MEMFHNRGIISSEAQLRHRQELHEREQQRASKKRPREAEGRAIEARWADQRRADEAQRRQLREARRQEEAEARSQARLDALADIEEWRPGTPPGSSQQQQVHLLTTPSTRNQGGDMADLVTPPSTQPGRRSRKPRVLASGPVQEQKERLQEILDHVSHAFQQKVDASTNRTWCDPIPIQRKVETIQCHLKEMMDEDTLPTATCRFFYLKKGPKELAGLS